MKIISVVGARPNFMKVAPFIDAIEQYNLSNTQEQIEHMLVHTGQHYDDRMSDLFFKKYILIFILFFISSFSTMALVKSKQSGKLSKLESMLKSAQG